MAARIQPQAGIPKGPYAPRPKGQRPGEFQRLAERMYRERLERGEIQAPRSKAIKPDAKAKAAVKLCRQERRASAKRQARVLAAAKREFEAFIQREADERAGMHKGRRGISVGPRRRKVRVDPVDALLTAVEPWGDIA